MDLPTLQVGVKMLAIYKGKFLIARRSEKVYSGVKGTMWDIPGGRIDPAFSLFDNLKREIKEEVGLEIASSSVLRQAQDDKRTPPPASLVREHCGHGRNDEEHITLLGAQDIWVTAKNLHVIRLTYVGKVEGEIVLSHEHDEFKLASYAEMLELFDAENLIGQVLRASKQIIEDMMNL